MPQEDRGVRSYDKNNRLESPVIMDPLYRKDKYRRTVLDDLNDKVSNTRSVQMKSGKELKLRDIDPKTHFSRGEYSDKYERTSGYDPASEFIENEARLDAQAVQKYNRKKMEENAEDSLGTSAMFGKTALGGTQSNSPAKDDRYRRGMKIKK